MHFDSHYILLPLLLILMMAACNGASENVNQPPSVTLHKVDETRIELGSVVDILASASDEDGEVAYVLFFVNGAEAGRSTEEPHSFTFTPSALGRYELGALAYDDQALSSEVATRIVHVDEVEISELYMLSVIVDGEGSVTSEPLGIACPETCQAEFDLGQTVMLTAAPAEGSSFVGWSGACTGTGLNCQLSPASAADLSATATFQTSEPAPPTDPDPPTGEVAVELMPKEVTLEPGETQNFSATVTGTENTGLEWSATGGKISGSGSSITYTAPATAGTYTLTATSLADPDRKASATITVSAPLPDITITVSPKSASLMTGETQQFTATVAGSDNKAVVWNVTGGTVTGTGSAVSYKAPSTAGNYTLSATSRADSTKKATATVTVSAPPPEVTLTLSPKSADLITGDSKSFTATVTGGSTTAVTWKATGGSVGGTGKTVTYTAPSTAGDYILTATSVADTSKKASASISVTQPAPPSSSVKVVAVGDIVCGDYSPRGSGKCHDEETAALVSKINPDRVLLLGDNQYDPSTYQDFLDYYDKTWGKFKSITHPALGNHEYDSPTTKAEGYFKYFGSKAGEAGKGYYSFNLGDWHIIVLNTNKDCTIVACSAGSAQEKWLKADLAASSKKCTLAVMHHPRYNSGRHGSATVTKPLWAALHDAGADLVLAGHAHHYERFRPQDESGNRDDATGITSFVVGTGGKSLDAAGSAIKNSAKIINNTYGVLELDLKSGGFEWRFVPEAGSSGSDSGSASCH